MLFIPLTGPQCTMGFFWKKLSTIKKPRNISLWAAIIQIGSNPLWTEIRKTGLRRRWSGQAEDLIKIGQCWESVFSGIFPWMEWRSSVLSNNIAVDVVQDILGNGRNVPHHFTIFVPINDRRRDRVNIVAILYDHRFWIVKPGTAFRDRWVQVKWYAFGRLMDERKGTQRK